MSLTSKYFFKYVAVLIGVVLSIVGIYKGLYYFFFNMFGLDRVSTLLAIVATFFTFFILSCLYELAEAKAREEEGFRK